MLEAIFLTYTDPNSKDTQSTHTNRHKDVWSVLLQVKVRPSPLGKSCQELYDGAQVLSAMCPGN